MDTKDLDARQVAKQGDEIYRRKYRKDFELSHNGKFVAIDLKTESAFIADFPEQALSKAQTAFPESKFYLLRVGSTGAFKLSRISHAVDHRRI